MWRTIMSLPILMMSLSGCGVTNFEQAPTLHLPDMPTAGPAVADELAAVCDKNKCPNITKWLNELHFF